MNTDLDTAYLTRKLKHPLHEYQRVYVLLPKYPLTDVVEIWASRFADNNVEDELVQTCDDPDTARIFCGPYRAVFAKARQHGV